MKETHFPPSPLFAATTIVAIIWTTAFAVIVDGGALWKKFHAPPVSTQRVASLLPITGEPESASKFSAQRAFGFEFEGVLAKVPHEVGDVVRAGDLLAAMDTEGPSSRLQVLKARLVEIELQHRNAALNAQPCDETFALVMALLIEEAKLECRIAQSSLIAPYDVTVTARHRAVGETAANGEPVLEVVELDSPRQSQLCSWSR